MTVHQLYKGWFTGIARLEKMYGIAVLQPL
jgi:hypothetical protein